MIPRFAFNWLSPSTVLRRKKKKELFKKKILKGLRGFLKKEIGKNEGRKKRW